jgi:hypothetical protein
MTNKKLVTTKIKVVRTSILTYRNFITVIRNITMNNIAKFLIIIAILLIFWFFSNSENIFGNTYIPDNSKIEHIQKFIVGIVMPLITLVTTLLLIKTFENNNLQNFSNNLFKLIDQNKKLLEGINKTTLAENILNVEENTEEYKNVNGSNETISATQNSILQEPIKSNGKDFFDDICEKIALTHSSIEKQDFEYLKQIPLELQKKVGDKRKKEMLIIIYDYYFHIYQSDLGHYFRNLYHIVKYIDSSSITDDEKKLFIGILRSQLSNYELLLLAYNGLHTYGAKFYPYLEKYEILKSINNETQLPPEYIKRIIDLEVLKEAYTSLKKEWEIIE